MICVHGGPCVGCMNCLVVDESLRLIGDAPEEVEDEG